MNSLKEITMNSRFYVYTGYKIWVAGKTIFNWTKVFLKAIERYSSLKYFCITTVYTILRKKKKNRVLIFPLMYVCIVGQKAILWPKSKKSVSGSL